MKKRSRRLTAAALALMMSFSMCLPAAAEVGGSGENSGTESEVSGVENGRQVINFNTDWHFAKGDAAGAGQENFNDDSWVYVNPAAFYKLL